MHGVPINKVYTIYLYTSRKLPRKQTPLNKKLYKSILLFIKNAARIEGARSVPRKRYGARLARNPTQLKFAYEFAKQTR